MQDRDPGDDRDVGNLKAPKAYSLTGAIRAAFQVGAFGLGANGNISKPSSLITAVTVEGFCSTLALIVVIHEIISVCGTQCCRRDGRTVESTTHSPTEYSTYLSFRLASILISFVGMSLVAADIATDATTVKSTVGIVAMALGIFATDALNGTRQKPAGIVLSPEGDIEMGLLPGPPPPNQQRAARVDEPRDAPLRQARVTNRNQFFQEDGQPSARPQGERPRKVVWVKKARKKKPPVAAEVHELQPVQTPANPGLNSNN